MGVQPSPAPRFRWLVRQQGGGRHHTPTRLVALRGYAKNPWVETIQPAEHKGTHPILRHGNVTGSYVFLWPPFQAVSDCWHGTSRADHTLPGPRPIRERDHTTPSPAGAFRG